MYYAGRSRDTFRILEYMRRIQVILQSLRPILSVGCALLLCLVSANCAKEQSDEAPAYVFGGPADVTLLVEGNPVSDALSKAVYPVDEDGIIVESVRIYAFKHAPGQSENNEQVGYGYFDGLDVGAGDTEYCPMRLTASGQIDFYVLANDKYVLASDGSPLSLDENTSRTDLENLRFFALAADATAVPMSSFEFKTNPAGDLTTEPNRTFTVQESSDSEVPQIIPVEIVRSMARLSFFFAKSEDSPVVTINRIDIRPQGPRSAGFFVQTGEPDGYSQEGEKVSLVETPERITLSNTTGNLEDNDLQKTENDAYLLPNGYGSGNPDAAPAGDDGQYGYVAEIEYQVEGQEARSKTVWLPAVRPNRWIKVKGIFNTPVDVNIIVIALDWNESNNRVDFN